MSVYAVSDLHGCYNLYEQICKFIKKNDLIIFLGDAGDRGPQSWKTIKAIYNNPQWIYLKGNHEDMLVKAMQYLKKETSYWRDDPYTLCVYNGGGRTIDDWVKTDGGNSYWITALKQLPLSYKYLNKNGKEIILTHAGFTDQGQIPVEEDLLWDRKHISDPIDWFKTNRIIVHGHTPIPHLAKSMNLQKCIDTNNFKPFWYCDNHKVDIDCGSFVSYQTVLLNLDTFEYHNFKEDKIG